MRKNILVFMIFIFLFCSSHYQKKLNYSESSNIIPIINDTCFSVGSDTLLVALKVKFFASKTAKNEYVNKQLKQIIKEKKYYTYWVLSLGLEAKNKIINVNNNSYLADKSIIYVIIKGIKNQDNIKKNNQVDVNQTSTKPEDLEIKKEEGTKGYNEGYSAGRAAGSQKDQTFWMGTGFGGGLLLGCIGGGGVWLIANNSGDHPPYVPGTNSEYSWGYLDGYLTATKSKRASSACMGSICGMVITASIITLIFLVK
jgi:hypothetical protein